jgi:hypothetical protein
VSLGATKSVLRKALQKLEGAPQAPASIFDPPPEKLRAWRRASGQSLQAASVGSLVSVDHLFRAEHGKLNLTAEECDRVKAFYWGTIKKNLRYVLPELVAAEQLSPVCLAEFLAMLGSSR